MNQTWFGKHRDRFYPHTMIIILTEKIRALHLTNKAQKKEAIKTEQKCFSISFEKKLPKRF